MFQNANMKSRKKCVLERDFSGITIFGVKIKGPCFEMCFCDVIVEGLLLAANTIRALHIMTDTNQERVRNAKDSISITIQKARDRVDLRSFFFSFLFLFAFSLSHNREQLVKYLEMFCRVLFFFVPFPLFYGPQLFC